MRYLCLVYGEERTLDARSKAESEALVRDSIDYDEALRNSGHLVVAHALAPVRSAKTVRVRNKKASTTDGPFAETKEQLLGFILIEAADENDALRVAAKIPLASVGSVEVRAIKELAVDS